MASLTNTKIKNTYVSLLKVADNGQLDAALQDITDGAGNSTGIQLNTGGDLTASGTVSFGSLKDTGENITISKFVDAADGIGGNDNDTSIPTSAAVKLYVDTNITAQDLDFTTDSGTGAVDLDSQTFSILGTANEIETSGTGQTVTIGLPSSITVDVTGNLTGNVSGSVTGNVTGNLSGNVTGNVTGDITGNVTATSVLVDGVIATTQSIGDNSTKVATTAYVDAAITAEGLDFAGDAGSGTIDLDSEVFTISGTANEVETNASGNSLIVGLPSNVTIGNDLTVTTNATVGGTLGVTGSTGVDGNFDVATNKFTVQAATGNTAVAGTLDATGLASLDGGIDVDGAFTVADTTGNVSTTGTLAVTGITTLTDDLAVDTDTLFVDVSTDRVGINKAVPTVALDVTGDITSSATITGVTLEGTLSSIYRYKKCYCGIV
jgi:trimeric autotransporter adhesin